MTSTQSAIITIEAKEQGEVEQESGPATCAWILELLKKTPTFDLKTNFLNIRKIQEIAKNVQSAIQGVKVNPDLRIAEEQVDFNKTPTKKNITVLVVGEYKIFRRWVSYLIGMTG
ncbi:hypothetical protein SD80_020255 [Scytonema tolypothrichoides VB-61278]|nr:hypothetical protein SD80_020255 [Scytonema tolypothrichoides VB-61278]